MNRVLTVLMVTCVAGAAAMAGDWQPKQAPLMTRWAAEVQSTRVQPEYPRPQMVRAEWLNLNGLWDYAIRPKDAPRPVEFDGQMLVPFPVESALSGVMQRVAENQRLWYRRSFCVPAAWAGKLSVPTLQAKHKAAIHLVDDIKCMLASTLFRRKNWLSHNRCAAKRDRVPSKAIHRKSED